MQSKKLVSIVFLSMVSVLLLSVFVSAGFLDSLFGNDEPQLAPFNASVTVQTGEPVIVFVSEATDGVVSGTVNPIVDDAVSASFSFIARHPNGQSALSDATATAVFHGPAGTTTPSGTCSAVGNVAGSSTDRNYSCSVDMQYYYEPGTDNWIMNVSVQDTSAQTARNDTQTFTYTTTTGVDTVSEVNWSSLSVASTASNQEADGPLTLQNKGNVDLTAVDVNATALNGTGSNPEIGIPADRFSSGGSTSSGSCNVGTDGFQLVDNIDVGITNVNVPFGPPGVSQEGPLYFCIYPAVDDLGLVTTQTYSTSSPASRSWEVTV